ncbi:DUF3519 domain-containing protein [Helicobacter pylori]|uniref:DUF3519 domain-containing protein n=1 Tax=Helicobacter pylori TaxID=210 RepID=UPI001F393701|nr:DUF3519 domain-containing protein [Helicobacter pylori]
MKLPKALNEATAGAALKYHIKRALERSHSISEFSKNLELSAKNAKFSNNTLKIIEELNNGIKQASEEIKEASKKSAEIKRDYSDTKLSNDEIKALLNNAKIPTSGRDAITFGVNNLNPEIVEFLHKNNKKMIIEKASNKELELLKDANFKHPENIRASLDHEAITHILKRHGVDSVNVKNGEIPITYEDIANYRYIVNNADAILRTLDNEDKEVISAFKQINGYAVVVEQAINKKNELVLKTMYKSNGDYKNNDVYKEFSSTSLDANAKVRHGLSSHSGATDNPIPKPLNSQEDLLKNTELDNETTKDATHLSPLEQANAEKLAKLQREQEQSEQEFLKAKEQETKRKEALKKKLEHERGNAGNIESQTKIEVGEDIPTKTQEQLPKSRVRLNEREIYDLDYAIVKAKDLKPSFTTGGTQKRTDMNEEQIKSIAQNFDPKKIFGSGGFEDLPIILHDGQVIAGNHRIQGMLNFTPKSRYIYHKAIQEYYHIDLKPDELLVRVPNKRLDNTEINNLAASSNQGRFNSESDHAIAVLSHYEAKLKELDQKLDADSIYSLKNIVAKNLNFDKATHPNVGDSNLALLMYNMPRTKTQGIELLNRWQKEFSNDIKSYEKVKKMFVDNAGSFHNLIHDMNFPKVSLNAYLSDIMDRSFANLKNYQTTSESLKDLSEKFYKTSSLDMFEKSDQTTSDISEILGGAIARFARFDDPSKALFEALKSDNIKKGLKEFKIADVTKDMFDPKSKEFKDIDIYDFTHYLLMVNREPNENNPVLNRLIQAVKDMQKENEKGSKPKLETQWGPNYSEFKNDGLGAINKLLETKKGFVAGAFYKEGLGDIDLIWGNKDYGLEHILKRREKQAKNQGLNEQQAKEYALNIAKTIPEVIDKGVKVDNNGRMAIEYQNIRVGINNDWYSEKLPNKWVISSYEIHNSESEPPSLLMAQLQGVGLGTPKLTEPNPTTNALKTQEPLSEQANAKKLLKLQHAITPLKEFGKNYPEFSLKPKEALEKLLQEKNGQVAGTAYREDLGGIDFVWRTPKTKDSNGYGLAHILEKREKQYKRLGLTNEQAKERTKELLKQIPEVIEKGIKDNDYIGHATIRHNGIEVGLSSQKGNTPLRNHYMITSFETDEKVLRELETIGTLSNNYRDGINYNTSNPNEPNPTTNALKTQETLSEQANAKKLLKLESEKGIKAEALKKLNFDEIKKLIDESPRTGSSMPILGMQNLNAEAVEYIQKNHKRIAVEKIEPSFAKDLKLKYPDDARAVIDYQAINHILKEHKNLSFEDIANYRELSKQANETLKLKDNQNRPVVASFNQINGFFVVVEQVSNAKNELMLKTMYKARGNYKDSLIYKRTLAKSQNSN